MAIATKETATEKLAKQTTVGAVLGLIHSGEITPEQAEKRIKELTSRNRPANKITYSVSKDKKVLCVYGLQVRPVSLYAGQWLRLLDSEVVAGILKYIEEHKSELAWKDGQASE